MKASHRRSEAAARGGRTAVITAQQVTLSSDDETGGQFDEGGLLCWRELVSSAELPDAKPATPLVKVLSFGFCVETLKCRANAYPASESKKTRPTVPLTVTTTELVNHRGRSAWNNLRKASAVQLRGVRVSEFVPASASLLKEVPICRRKGKRLTIAKRSTPDRTATPCRHAGIDTADRHGQWPRHRSPSCLERRSSQHDHLRLSFSRASESDIDKGIARIARAVAAARAV